MEILVLRLSSLGDVVLTSSFLQAAAARFPGARITYVVRDDLAALATALPHVARVVAVDRQLGFSGLLALGRELGDGDFEHVFDLHASLRSRLLCWGLWRRRRGGFGKQELPRWLLLYAHRDLYARFGGAQPVRERMLEPLRSLGPLSQVPETRLVLQEPARAAAAAALAGVEATCIAMAPGARWPTKRWPEARFALLAGRLVADGFHVVLVGSSDERELAARIGAAIGPGCTNVAGRLDLLATAAAIEHCQAFVGNDSGLLHVAEAVGRPALGFFGPTSPRFGYTPYRDASRILFRPPACNPCSKNGSRPCHRPTHECMLNIDVEAAHAAVRALLQPAPARA